MILKLFIKFLKIRRGSFFCTGAFFCTTVSYKTLLNFFNIFYLLKKKMKLKKSLLINYKFSLLIFESFIYFY